MTKKEIKKQIAQYDVIVKKVPFQPIYYLMYEVGYNCKIMIYYNRIFDSLESVLTFLKNNSKAVL